MFHDFILPIQHWIAIHTGTENAGPDKYYNWWSGFASDFGELTLITGVGIWIWHLNCHEHGCKRLTRQVTTDGHKLCRRHIRLPKEELHLHEVHSDHSGHLS